MINTNYSSSANQVSAYKPADPEGLQAELNRQYAHLPTYLRPVLGRAEVDFNDAMNFINNNNARLGLTSNATVENRATNTSCTPAETQNSAQTTNNLNQLLNNLIIQLLNAISMACK